MEGGTGRVGKGEKTPQKKGSAPWVWPKDPPRIFQEKWNFSRKIE